MNERIKEINIAEEMKTAYIDYSMSVIVSRAIPDVRDGLKPVQRRVLYGMAELGLLHNRPYKKSARIVGEVLGKYHPHGDSAVYETLVRMAQPWVLRYTLVEGQGNFGSIDGDSAAAMRYTEARLTRIAEELLADISLDTVDFAPNFDDSLKEPTVLPAKIPNLLMNGASGIAVGMATNMAPHNLSELVAGIKAYIDNNDITIDELANYIKAPDFPTGGYIYGYSGVKKAFATGRGAIKIRAKLHVEEISRQRQAIIVTELPYQVNKATLVEKIAALRDLKKIEGIGEIRDESNREGMRIVIELKKSVVPKVIINKLYKHTQLETNFNVNNIALVNGRPMQLTLKDLIKYYVEHRHEIVIRRTKYLLKQAEARAHILEGLLIALDNLDEVIRLIRASKTPDIAKEGLMKKFKLSEIQAKAILDMRLQRLTNLESEKIRKEYAEVKAKIEEYKKILATPELQFNIIKEELDEINKKYGDKRRTEIIYSAQEISIEDLIKKEDVIVTISHLGYIKRTSLEEFALQRRGGVGRKGASTKDTDFITNIFHVNSHDYLLFFTKKGKCYWLRAFDVPETQRIGKGRAIQNLIQIDSDDKVLSILNVPDLKAEGSYVFFATRKGIVKRVPLKDFSNPRSKGIIAIGIAEGDELLGADLCKDSDECLLISQNGYGNRFSCSDVRPMGRSARGVKGMELAANSEVVSLLIASSPEQEVLVLSEYGYGKRTKVEAYRKTKRGSKGVRTMKISEKTGNVIGAILVDAEDEFMIITEKGTAIRSKVKLVSSQSRNTQGVRLIRLRKEDKIAAIEKIAPMEEPQE